VQIFFCQKKIQSQTVIREKLSKALLYNQSECKILLKLTPDKKFLNVETLSVLRSFYPKYAAIQSIIKIIKKVFWAQVNFSGDKLYFFEFWELLKSIICQQVSGLGAGIR